MYSTSSYPANSMHMRRYTLKECILATSYYRIAGRSRVRRKATFSLEVDLTNFR